MVGAKLDRAGVGVEGGVLPDFATASGRAPDVHLRGGSLGAMAGPARAGPGDDGAGGEWPALGQVFDFDEDIVVLLVDRRDRRAPPGLVRVAAGAVHPARANGNDDRVRPDRGG